MAASGQAVSLCYGYNWITGEPLQKNTLQNTGNKNLDYTRIGFWLCGEGEWDDVVEVWDTGTGRLLFTNANQTFNTNTGDLSGLHFHRGCDAVAGSGFAQTSTGPDQGVDTLWQYLPPGLQPLHYHRWAYYAIMLKQPALGLTGTPDQANPDSWVDVSPIGLWRTMRCRQFDASGNLIGYGFTRNPAWQFVDLLCRRKFFPEFTLTFGQGAQDLPSAVRARFDWGAIAETAAYFGEIVSSGLPRFSGDFAFSQRTTLQACITQILTSSRSFIRERAGQISIVADKPRASVFTFSRKNAELPTPTDADVHTAANMYIGAFRDLLIPACATIANLTVSNSQAVVNTELPHCLALDDYIAIGNTGTNFDTYWQVVSVPVPDANGNVTQFTIGGVGSNYPSSLGSGGLVGLRFSRFKDRTPQFEHHAHQLTQGVAGFGIDRYRNRRPVTTDFGNCTWDQVSRVSFWQRIVALGPDVQPYVTPPRLTLKAGLFEADAAGSGAIAMQIEPGDRVTIDDTLSAAYAGDYEVAPQASITLTGMNNSTPTAGSCTFTLRPYSDGNYPDSSTSNQPGIVDVPLLPGGGTTSTGIPLQGGGSMAFFSGSGADQTSFNIPDGYDPAYMLAWASPQGFVQANQQMHVIFQCDATSGRVVLCRYSDGSVNTWTGDANYAGFVWSASAAAAPGRITNNQMQWTELTLLGGEVILIGKGRFQSGVDIPLPAGYTWANAIALGLPYSAADTGHPAHGFGGWVEPDTQSGGYRGQYYSRDGEGNITYGLVSVMIFAWRNNAGTWKDSGNGWHSCPLPNGQTFAVLGASILDSSLNGATPTVYPTTTLFQVPNGGKIPQLLGMSASTLQTMTGPNGFQITDHDAHGIRLCQVDSSGNATCTFEDGEGNVWPGSSGVFGILCDKPS